jgi:hypothetical protein
LIQRQRFPHFLNTLGWIHIVPKNDVITHEHAPNQYDCPCGPVVDCAHRVVCHHALDARGKYTPDSTTWEVCNG